MVDGRFDDKKNNRHTIVATHWLQTAAIILALTCAKDTFSMQEPSITNTTYTVETNQTCTKEQERFGKILTEIVDRIEICRNGAQRNRQIMFINVALVGAAAVTLLPILYITYQQILNTEKRIVHIQGPEGAIPQSHR